MELPGRRKRAGPQRRLMQAMQSERGERVLTHIPVSTHLSVKATTPLTSLSLSETASSGLKRNSSSLFFAASLLASFLNQKCKKQFN